jgi:hypothetical protein
MIRVYGVDIYALILECGMLSGETANINFIVFGLDPTGDRIFDLQIMLTVQLYLSEPLSHYKHGN